MGSLYCDSLATKGNTVKEVVRTKTAYVCEGKTKKQPQIQRSCYLFCDLAGWPRLLISYASFIQIV